MLTCYALLICRLIDRQNLVPFVYDRVFNLRHSLREISFLILAKCNPTAKIKDACANRYDCAYHSDTASSKTVHNRSEDCLFVSPIDLDCLCRQCVCYALVVFGVTKIIRHVMIHAVTIEAKAVTFFYYIL